MKSVNPNAVAAILKWIVAAAVVVLLCIFASCSPQRKTNKAIQRVLANREALDKVGAEWKKLNPCANNYIQGQWIELTDSSKLYPVGRLALGNGTLLPTPLPNPWPETHVPVPIPPASNDSNVAEPIPNHIEAVGDWEQLFLVSPDGKSILHNGKTYWWPQRRFIRIDTVQDHREIDSLKAEAARKDIAMAQTQGKLDEARQLAKTEAARGDKWFWWFVVSVIVGVVLLIVSHLIRSRIKL